jgi:hypothetical protein
LAEERALTTNGGGWTRDHGPKPMRFIHLPDWPVRLACVVVLSALAGCQGPGKSAAKGPVVQKLNLVQIEHDASLAAGGQGSLDPAGDAAIYLYLDIYQLTVPYGTISTNEEFWKRINEQSVDVTTYDLLFKNGIRVGQASTADWDYFKKIIDQNPATTQTSTLTGAPGKVMELEIKKDVPAQTLFYFDSQNVLQGRSYDESDNLLAVSFEPAPRKLGTARITLCPMLRATRKRLQYTVLNDEREIQYVAAERLFDLNLCADVPPGNFLVVAPSIEARSATSVGRAFFTRDGQAERLEEIFLIVPHPFRVEKPALARSGH